MSFVKLHSIQIEAKSLTRYENSIVDLSHSTSLIMLIVGSKGDNGPLVHHYFISIAKYVGPEWAY